MILWLWAARSTVIITNFHCRCAILNMPRN